MQDMHRIIWRGPDDCTVTRSSDGTVLVGTALVTTFQGRATVGIKFDQPDVFGYWHGYADNAIVAWQAAQLLPHLEVKRAQFWPYISTMHAIVDAIKGTSPEPMPGILAQDFPGFTEEEFYAELKRLADLWPAPRELCAIWDKLSERQQEDLVDDVMMALGSGHLVHTAGVMSRLEAANTRIATQAAEGEHLLTETLRDIGIIDGGSNAEHNSAEESAPKRGKLWFLGIGRRV